VGPSLFVPRSSDDGDCSKPFAGPAFKPRVGTRPQGASGGLRPRVTSLKDRLGDQRGGSEWEPIKILLQRENSAYVPNSQPRIPTRVCQGYIVTTDLPTLGTNPKRSQSRSTSQEAKDLAALRNTKWTVRGDRADGPHGTGGRFASVDGVFWYTKHVYLKDQIATREGGVNRSR
jgi:hypothetical protein